MNIYCGKFKYVRSSSEVCQTSFPPDEILNEETQIPNAQNRSKTDVYTLIFLQ
jgi:hypothetical protein